MTCAPVCWVSVYNTYCFCVMFTVWGVLGCNNTVTAESHEWLWVSSQLVRNWLECCDKALQRVLGERKSTPTSLYLMHQAVYLQLLGRCFGRELSCAVTPWFLDMTGLATCSTAQDPFQATFWAAWLCLCKYASGVRGFSRVLYYLWSLPSINQWQGIYKGNQ